MTIMFPDASQYNAAMPDAPAQVARATIGAVKDTRYEFHKTTAAQRGRRFMAYSFLNHESLALTATSGGPGISAEQQADAAFAVIGPSIPCMLDWESNRGKDATVDMAWRFINRYRSHGGILHSYYLPHWFWQDHLGSPDLRGFALHGLGLVSSNYTTYSDNGAGWAGYGGVYPFQWQFTDNWLGSGCDGNAFRGTIEEWWSIVTGGNSMASEWSASPGDPGWALTQGTKGYAGQQRDTALAFAWQNAVEANQNAGQALVQSQSNGSAISALKDDVEAVKEALASMGPMDPSTDPAALGSAVADALAANETFLNAVANRVLDLQQQRLQQ